VDASTPQGAASSITLAGPDDLGAWDAFVASTPGGEITQTTPWARVRGRLGFEARTLLLRDSDHLIGGVQILLRRVASVGTIGYVPYGPLLAPGQPREACDCLVSGLRAHMPRRASALFVQPPLQGGAIVDALQAAAFRASDANVAPPASARVDLATHDPAARPASKHRRRLLKLWAARGVTVRAAALEDVEEFAGLHRHAAMRHGFEPLPFAYLHAMVEELMPRGMARLMIGEVAGRPIAGQLLTICGPVVTERVGGFRLTPESAPLRVPAAVSWAGMAWAKAQGARWYDVGGVTVDDARRVLDGGWAALDAEHRTRPFKFMFGARPFVYPPAVELVQGRFSRAAYDTLQRGGMGRRVVASVRNRLRRGTGGDR
jgi:lipid II:glycine glycyltransferase (peptidoglycan interpeptide bridge formation enzyme)